MTTNHAIEHDLAGWFDQQATTAPEELLSRAVRRIETTSQRPGLLVRDTYPSARLDVGRPLLATAVLALVVVLAAAMAMAVGGPVTTPRPTGTTTNGQWAPGTELAFQARFDHADDVPLLKWRAGAYSMYAISGWQWGDVERVKVAAGERLPFSDEGDAGTPGARRPIDIMITPRTFIDRTVLGPNVLQSVDKPVVAIARGKGDWFASIEAEEGGAPYTVSALIPVDPSEAGGLTEARLRGAGTAYSGAMLATYTALPDGAMGPAAAELLKAIRAAVPPGHDADNPYDLARATERYLRSGGNFQYDADVREEVDAHCSDISTVECFAIIKRGYCEYYASTMAVLLRESGVPARIAYGFLPGERAQDAVEDVGAWLAHWWVEVYFPGVGWFEFDPTGGGVGLPQSLPPGS